jgi:predicted DNA-binding WGR domain protein
MTMFRAKVHRSIHEGGTKFYQQVQVDCVPLGKSFLVQHWGKWTGGTHGFDLASGRKGTRLIKKTETFRANTEFADKEEAKRKRGYHFADRKTHNCANVEELERLLTGTLGATALQTADITDYFGMRKNDAMAYVPVTTVGAGDVPETEGWGEW